MDTLHPQLRGLQISSPCLSWSFHSSSQPLCRADVSVVAESNLSHFLLSRILNLVFYLKTCHQIQSRIDVFFFLSCVTSRSFTLMCFIFRFLRHFEFLWESIKSMSRSRIFLFVFFCHRAHSCTSLWLTPLFLMGFFCTLVEDLFQRRRVPHCDLHPRQWSCRCCFL